MRVNPFYSKRNHTGTNREPVSGGVVPGPPLPVGEGSGTAWTEKPPQNPRLNYRERFAEFVFLLELAFWLAVLVIVALVVGAIRAHPMVRSKADAPCGVQLRLVSEDEPDGIDPLTDLVGVMS